MKTNDNLKYVENLTGFDDNEEPKYRIPKKVVCTKCKKVCGVRVDVYKIRVFKIIKELFNMSTEEAEKLDIEDNRFQKAAKKLDSKYECRICRKKTNAQKIRIPIILEDGSSTIDYSCMQ